MPVDAPCGHSPERVGASYLACVPLLPIHGHETLRQRLDDAIQRDALPGSLLLQGPLGIGKQRLALWLGQRLLCTGAEPRPCGGCQHCRYAIAGTHPDIHWYFPRPRLKDPDPSPEDVEDDFREAVGDRTKTGAYPPPPPEDAILIATIRAMAHSAALLPALGARKVYVLGDADRLVVREDSEFAAGAFLKLLEEPPPRATIVLTSSEPGALIPTIRSRVVAIRVPRLSPRAVDSVLEEPAMRDALASAGVPPQLDEQRRLANGAPGRLARARRVGGRPRESPLDARRRRRRRPSRSDARGARPGRSEGPRRVQHVARRAHDADPRARANGRRARKFPRCPRGGPARSMRSRRPRSCATGNVNPQLITSELLRQLEAVLR